MQYFNVDPRDGFKAGGSCNTCCCKAIVMQAGVIDSIELNYAGWTLPLGGRGISAVTVLSFEKKTVDVAGENQSPVVVFHGQSTAFNTAITANLSSYATDPESLPMTFKALSLFGPQHGELTVADSGAFTYTPNTGYVGPDSFYYEVSDGANPPVVGQYAIYVQASTGSAVPVQSAQTPIIQAPANRRVVDSHWQTLKIALDISPAARKGDIYRMSVKQQALDCDCNPFYHVSCYDILIGNC